MYNLLKCRARMVKNQHTQISKIKSSERPFNTEIYIWLAFLPLDKKHKTQSKCQMPSHSTCRNHMNGTSMSQIHLCRIWCNGGNREYHARLQIAVAAKIPYALLKIWHENVQERRDCIDFLNFTVPGAWFRVSRETGFRIQRSLEREAGVVASKYRQTKGRKKEQLNSKFLTLSIRLHSELVSVQGVERELHLTRKWTFRLEDKISWLRSRKAKTDKWNEELC